MDEVQAGHQAERLLGDPVFQAAVTELDSVIVEEWRIASTLDEREKAHARQAVLRAIVQQLEVLVGRGEVAEHRQV